MTDFELLRQYVDDGSQSAFAELVARHMGLVYSAAMRQLNDSHLAQDVAQGVFINLARSANKIGQKTVIAGWLLTATRYLSLDAKKLKGRRLRHERRAAMNELQQTNEDARDWEQIAPVLDEAIAKLPARNRDALTLRYFQNKSVREVAQSLQISEDAAKQRLSRAVAKLRSLLVARGVRIGAGVLVALLSANAVQAYPADLLNKTVVMATAAGKGGFSLIGVLKMIALHKIKAAVVVVMMLAGLAAVTAATRENQGADDAARVDAILKKARAALDKAHSMSAKLDILESGGGKTNHRIANVALQKPNLGRLTYLDAAGGALRTEISDGRQLYIVYNPDKIYHRPLTHGHTPEHLLTSVIPVLAGFWSSDPLIIGPDKIEYGGTETIDDQSYDLIRYSYKDSTSTGKVYFSATTGLLSGWIQSSGGKNPVIARQWLTDIQFDPAIEPITFTFDPNFLGLKEFERSKEFDKALVQVGQATPEFSLARAGGGKLSSADARKGKKAVLVNFWFCDCAACRQELPQLQRLYNELKDKGLEIIAIDNGDSDERIQEVAKDSKLTFPIVIGGENGNFVIGEKYGVAAYPTNFLIDANGKVLWRGAGFDEREIMAELKKAGILAD
jgi:RNA polymerase sigma factor (sigma-70 family)